MAKHEVTCTERHSIHQRIISIGCNDATTGAQRRYSEEEAIRLIEAKTDVFVVRDQQGHEAILEVEERDGRKFLITKRDHYKTDNLSALPACTSKPIVAPPTQPYRPVTPARSHCVRAAWKVWA
jgi:hypothetical protein